MRHHHYDTGGYRANVTFLDDAEYGRALDALVKGCVDVLLLDASGARVLLGLRKHEPAMGDWWYVGGRMRCGERVEETARRHALRDIGVEIDVERFNYVASSTMNWRMRVQEPVENGTCDINVVMTATLREEEVARRTMCELEYVEQKFWDLDEVIANVDGLFPLAIQNATRRLVFVRREDELFAAVRAGASDEEIARLARRAHEMA